MWVFIWFRDVWNQFKALLPQIFEGFIFLFLIKGMYVCLCLGAMCTYASEGQKRD